MIDSSGRHQLALFEIRQNHEPAADLMLLGDSAVQPAAGHGSCYSASTPVAVQVAAGSTPSSTMEKVSARLGSAALLPESARQLLSPTLLIAADLTACWSQFGSWTSFWCCSVATLHSIDARSVGPATSLRLRLCAHIPARSSLNSTAAPCMRRLLPRRRGWRRSPGASSPRTCRQVAVHTALFSPSGRAVGGVVAISSGVACHMTSRPAGSLVEEEARWPRSQPSRNAQCASPPPPMQSVPRIRHFS
jgi:hypothetical protein